MCIWWWIAAVLLVLLGPMSTANAQTPSVRGVPRTGGFVPPQSLPPTEPIPLIETGMHSAPIKRIGVNETCRLMVTGSDDKTARLWALPESGSGEPKLLHVLRVPIGTGDEGKVYAVALSPDGRFVAAGGFEAPGQRAVYIFDTVTGEMIRRLGNAENAVIYHLTFSADSKYLVAMLDTGQGMRAWQTTDWTLVGVDRDYGGSNSYGAAFDAKGALYTVAFDGYLRRYGPGFKLEAKSKVLGGNRPYSVAVRPNGDRLAVVFDDSLAVDVYRTKDLQFEFGASPAFPAAQNGILAVAWSTDGERLYAGGSYYDASYRRMIRIWDQEGRGQGHDVPVAWNTIMQLLPCRDEIAVGAQDPAFGLISATGEKRVWRDGTSPDMRDKLGRNFTVSADGSKVRFGLGVGGHTPVLFDLVTARLTEERQPVAGPTGLATPDTESLKLSDWRNNTAPKLDGSPITLERYEIARSVAVAPGSDHFVLGAEWSLRYYEKSGKQLWRRPAPSIVWGVNVSSGGKFAIAAYGDGTIRWHRLSDGAEVLALFVNAKTREWVLWTPQGYYTSSVAGDQNIGWQINKGRDQAGVFVTAAQLKKDFYRPDIIKRAFELADAGQAIREAGLSAVKLATLTNHTPPKFQISDLNDNVRVSTSPLPVKIELATSDDPVTGLDVKVNGRQVTERAVRDARETQSRTLNIPLEKGENHIQITAHNAVGDTVRELLVYLDREGVLDKKGKLFIIAVGVDKYPKLGAENSLRFAGADARLMLDTLTKKAGPLHTEVKSQLLVTGGDMPPTKANIEDALLLFGEAKPEDTVILFLAGHGVNEGGDYLFMPENAEDTPGAKNYRPSTVVRWHVLQEALQEAQGTRIMFVDTCHSRGAYNPRLIKDAADASIIVFSATDSTTEAQELGDLGHGVFTYALNEGLSGKADLMKRGAINISALFEFVSDEVKHLTNDAQEPTFSASGVKNFVVARP